MEKSTISQAMLKVSELERIYRDKMYKMMDLENIIQEYILESDGSRYDCNEVVDFNREFELIIELGEENFSNKRQKYLKLIMKIT